MTPVDRVKFFDEETGDDEKKESAVVFVKNADTLVIQILIEEADDDPQSVSFVVEGRVDQDMDFEAISTSDTDDVKRYVVAGLSEVRVSITFGNVTDVQSKITIIGVTYKN